MWRFFLGLPVDAARLGLGAGRWVVAPPGLRFGVFPGMHFCARSALFSFLCALLLGDWVRSVLTHEAGLGPPVGVCALGLVLTSTLALVASAVSLVLSAGINEQWPRRGGG